MGRKGLAFPQDGTARLRALLGAQAFPRPGFENFQAARGPGFENAQAGRGAPPGYGRRHASRPPMYAPPDVEVDDSVADDISEMNPPSRPEDIHIDASRPEDIHMNSPRPENINMNVPRPEDIRRPRRGDSQAVGSRPPRRRPL